MIQLVLNSYLRPRQVISRVLRFDVSERELLIAAALICCVVAAASGLLTFIQPRQAGGIGEVTAGSGTLSPILEAIMNFVILIATAQVVDRLGRAFGGKGTRLNALKAVVWHSLIAAPPLLILAALMMMEQPFAWFLYFVMIGVLTVVFAVFVQEVHRFQSLLLTLLGILVAAFLFTFALVVVLSMTGIIRAP